MAAEVAIRLDTEDFLTPESDLALASILDALERHGARATFPLVAAKLAAWQRWGHGDLVARLGRHAVGYHSATHSLHPTIAEELAPLSWSEAQAAFAAREAAGFAAVQAAFGPPACWTQPGGNWTAAALPVLRGWGVPFEFSEAWNSYLDFGGAPCHYGGLLHWSPPVRAPKPFLSALPDCLEAAMAQIGQAMEDRSADDPPLCIVAHPTELCTTAFWDATNFARGHQPPEAEWRPAPLRSSQETAEAVAAFDAFLGGLRAFGLQCITAEELAARFPDRAAGAVLSRNDVEQLAFSVSGSAGWVEGEAFALSAAEVLGLLCAVLTAPGRNAVPVRFHAGPEDAPPSEAVRGPVARPDLLAAARWCAEFMDRHGWVPHGVPLGRGVAAPADLLAAMARALQDPDAPTLVLRETPVVGERYVKEPSRLHWDWPVFPNGFAPLGLWRQARLQAWTLKPAGERHGRAGRWQCAEVGPPAS